MKNKHRIWKYQALMSVLFILTISVKVSAQNYLINFTTTGSINIIDSVRVENLTQGTFLTITGNDTLHLTGTAGVNYLNINNEGVRVYPNPMMGQAELSFYAQKTGNARIEVYEVSGKAVLLVNDYVRQGSQKYLINGMKQGLYLLRISGENYVYSSKLISLNAMQSEIQSDYLGTENFEVDVSMSRTKSIVSMAYTSGDSLRFTGFSGIYSATINNVPIANETIIFNFESIPSVTTTSINLITATSAIAQSIVTSDGGDSVTVRGICWSTSTNPVVSGNHTTDGSGTGLFTSTISSLNGNTVYYVRAYATNSLGTAYGNELNFMTGTPPLLAIGDSYQGGIIAYILQAGDPGYNASVQHGLIAASTDQSAGIQWHNGFFLVTGATATALGTGNANTNTIVSIQGTGGYAAEMCYNLVLNGYSDWYLPSKDELYKLFLNKTAVGGFVSLLYWSSSEANATDAWFMSFNSGNQYSYGKNYLTAVRAIRAF